MELNEYKVISGVWSDRGLSLGAFLDSASVTPESSNCYQLFQTYSDCRLEYFKKDTVPDLNHLEQYRAFCEEWELWIRNINSRELRFRFISLIGKSTEEIRKDLAKKGCKLDNTVKLDAVETKEMRYPLWGDPLQKGENNKQGWYTARIPQIISYPVKFPEGQPKGKVFIRVENFIRNDRSVELVRYSGLDVSKE